MSKTTFTLMLSFFLAFLLLGAWTVMSVLMPPRPQPDYSATAVAQLLTQLAQTEPSATPAPVDPTVAPSATPFPTHTPTPLPTSTPAPTYTPTAAPLPCNWAQFEGDVTVPDGTRFTLGVPFTKTWRLRNIGSCTWTKGYALVLVRGEALGASTVAQLPAEVLPGQGIELSVPMWAPQKAGDVRGDWMLRDSAGGLFGTGPSRNGSFWVRITAREPNQVAFAFAERLCQAEWRLDDQWLDCQARPGDAAGVVRREAEPRLENQRLENEPALVVKADGEGGGLALGRFPAFRVAAGDRFRAVLGCLDANPDCRATFRLRYRIGGGAVETLATWEEKYDGKLTYADVDLTPLAGHDVQFFLSVRLHQGGESAQAFWLQPRILR